MVGTHRYTPSFLKQRFPMDRLIELRGFHGHHDIKRALIQAGAHFRAGEIEQFDAHARVLLSESADCQG
jgi:hypothetical protein